MKFECSDCKYITVNKSNFNKHLKSTRHVNCINLLALNANAISINANTVLSNQCTCGKSFKHSSSLSRHKKDCSGINLITEINNLKTELNNLKTMVNTSKESNHSVTNINNNKNTYNISVKNYVQNNYPNAPPLLKLENYDELVYDDSQERTLIDILVFNYNNGCLHKFLGDFIIKCYKKDDASQQSVWSSDISRLNYVVKELLADKESKWLDDKKGERVKKYIVDPLLKHIDNCCVEHFEENDEKMANMPSKIRNKEIFDDSDLNELTLTNYIYSTIYKIQKHISGGILADDIVKYIAQHFYMNKET